MLHEEQLKWATAKDLVDFLIRIIKRNLHLVDIGDFNIRLATDSSALRVIHQRLINTYKELRGQLKKKDPRVVSDNGTITKIQDHQKLYDSCVHWIGKEQQWEFRNLDSVYFESVNKDQHVGRVNKAGKIQGVGAKFNNSHEKVVATFNKHSKPVGWVKTYLNSIDHQEKISYYDEKGVEQVINIE